MVSVAEAVVLGVMVAVVVAVVVVQGGWVAGR